VQEERIGAAKVERARRVKVGDLVKISIKFTGHGTYEEDEPKIAMIVEGPNEVGKIKLLLSDGSTSWRHSSEVDCMPRMKEYLKQ
tara:strand:- start:1803 stop:2057 length:255 start_codon:yes stop_codon:yes gene_type:complete